MICYFPFTYISDEMIETLTRFLGPLAVYQAMEQRVPEHMRQWAERSLLEVRLPTSVDQTRLQRVLKEYKAWAELHQGSMADLDAFLQNAAEGVPLVDETDPTQISSQIRSHGRATKGVDPSFQASLFLAVGQDYDIHQEALTRELGAVERMEQQMRSQLEGGSNESGPRYIPTQDPGLYMTDARIQAWSLMAGGDARASWAFITTSRAVLEVILDKMPEARQVLRWDFGPEQLSVADDAAIAVRRNFLHDLAFSEDPWAMPAPGTLPHTGGTKARSVTFYCVPGCPPRKTLAALRRSTTADRSDPPEMPEPQHTLLGIMEGIHDNLLI